MLGLTNLLIKDHNAQNCHQEQRCELLIYLFAIIPKLLPVTCDEFCHFKGCLE